MRGSTVLRSFTTGHYQVHTEVTVQVFLYPSIESTGSIESSSLGNLDKYKLWHTATNFGWGFQIKGSQWFHHLKPTA